MAKWKLPEGREPLTAMESADLVLRMHDKLAAGFAKGDRIAELETDLAEQIEWVKRLADDLNAAEGREARLKAKLAKAEVIVRIIASDKWDERLGEAVDLSCEYLAELKGQDDE